MHSTRDSLTADGEPDGAVGWEPGLSLDVVGLPVTSNPEHRGC